MERAWNFVGDMTEARDYLLAPFAPPSELNFSPQPGKLNSPVIPERALMYFPGGTA